MENLAIYTAPAPFSNKQVKLFAPLGSSIAEIIAIMNPPSLGEALDAVVLIDGIVIPQEIWATTRPLPEQNTVINVIPGKGGGKNPLSIVLTIAVLYAAPQFAAWATAQAAMAGVTSLTGSMIVNVAARVAFSVVGSLLVNAIAPPPKPSNLGSGNTTESPTQFIEGARNSLTPYGVVPVCLGTNRMFPPQCARPYTETVDSDQFVRQLFTWGYGDKLLISDLKIGETDISEFDAVEMNHRLEGDLHLGTELYANDSYQENFNILLAHSTDVEAKTAATSYPIGTTVIGLAASGSGAIVNGDYVEFAGDTNQYLITSGDADVSNGGSITIASPGLLKALPASKAISVVAGFVLRTTQPNADEAIVDFTFPQGLTKFNSSGTRVNQRVQLEMQYSPTGLDQWTPASSTFKAITGTAFNFASLPVDPITQVYIPGSGYRYIGFRKDIIAIDNYSGVISVIQGTGSTATAAGAREPTLPKNAVRIATVISQGVKDWTGSGVTTTVYSVSDDRGPNIGTLFENSGSFAPSLGGTTVTIAAGGLSVNQLDVTSSQAEALRKSVVVKFPTRGQYDIRARRVTLDTNDDKIFDKAYLTSINSVTYRAPVNAEGVNGSAVRMKGTDQLNGLLDELNGLVSNCIPDYDIDSETWIVRATSNPASIYRYVLQGFPNARALPDAKLAISDLEAWHTYCLQKGYTYNRVIDYETSVADVLADVAAAGAASPAIVDGKRTVVVDCPKDDIVQVVTPRNSWQYSGEMIYPALPHAFRVTFRNAAKGYQQDEVIVYADGYDENNATIFETLEYQSCTNSDLAFKHARRFLANVILRPETHTFMLDFEHLVAIRGDRIILEHDVPVIGVGDGRIKEVLTDGNSPGLCTGIVIDDTVTIPDGATYYARVRLAEGGSIYQELITTVGDASTFMFRTPFSMASAPEVGDIAAFFEAGGELDLIIKEIQPQADLSARIVAVDYAPGIFTADETTIPPFNSKITTPLEFIRPVAPILLSTQSDEGVMLRNSDGSYTTRMVISLQNDNDGEIDTFVQIRTSGSTVFTNANVLEATAQRVVLTGLEDATNYDILIRYRRRGSNQYSLPLQINGYRFEGASAAPADVTGFEVTISGETANFKWQPNLDIDISHYKIKFSRVFSGALWSTAQVLEDEITTNRLTTVFQGGTYLIKAVDIRGNESENPALIVTYDEGEIRNVVEVMQEDPDFGGAKDNVILEGTTIVLADDSDDGYYYFENTIDLTDVFTSYRSAVVVANGTYINDLFDSPDLFAEDDLFGSGGGDLFAVDDLFSMTDMFGIGEGAWMVQLQSRTTNDDPVLDNWSEWAEFSAGNAQFRAEQYRLLLRSLAPGITPAVSVLSVSIDMPDRVEADNDLVVPVEGLDVVFSPAFKKLDGLSIVAQDLATGDYYTVTAKDEFGFTIQFFDSSGTPVSRTFDYVAAGYGRVISV